MLSDHRFVFIEFKKTHSEFFRRLIAVQKTGSLYLQKVPLNYFSFDDPTKTRGVSLPVEERNGVKMKSKPSKQP